MAKITRDPKNHDKWIINGLVKLPNGKWAHLKKKGYNFKKDAEDDFQRQRSLFIKRRGFKAGKGSFTELCESYLNHIRDLKKPTTFHDMERDIRSNLEDYFEGMSTDDVYSADCLEKWRTWFLEKTKDIGQKRVNWILHHLESISEYAFKTSLINENGIRLSMIASERIRERLSPKPIYSIWTKAQFDSFISTFEEGDRDMILFQWLFFSGCRIGEALALQWSDIDFGRKEVHISKSSSPGVGTGKTEIFTPKTSAGVRTIPINDYMRDRMIALKNNNEWGESDFVFFGKAPIGRMTVRRIFDEHTKKAGLPRLKIHEIRHTVNTWLLTPQRTTDELKAITTRLGRSSLKVTMDVYFHSHSDTERKLSEEIDVSKKK